MPERDLSELDIAAAFRAYLEDAPTEVRPMELARHFAVAYPRGRTSLARWGFGRAPALVWILLLAGVLLALVGGLVAGAWRTDRAVVVVPRTPAAFTGSMSTARDHPTARLLTDGRVLVVGGIDGAGALATAEIYDPSTGAFAPTGSMTAARVLPTATLLADGRVLVVGGTDSATAEVYDPRTGTFSATGSMTTARDRNAATLLADGRVLVVGGFDASLVLNSAELYDPMTGTFAPTGSMTTARDGHTATLLSDGRVLVVGGSPGGADGSAAGYVWLVLDSAEIYDPRTGTFALTGPVATARDAHTATLLRDGSVLVAGGYEESKDGLATAEMYDSRTGTFSPTGPMTSRRGSSTALLLPDGRVLVAGGRAANTIWVEVFSAEIYDPVTGAFGPTGPMATNRISFAATLLPDGRVLRAGGFDGGSEILASADIFDP